MLPRSSHPAEIEDFSTLVLPSVGRAVGADAVVLLAEPGDGSWPIRSTWGISGDQLARYFAWRSQLGSGEELADGPRLLASGDQLLGQAGIVAAATVPVSVDGRLVGGLDVLRFHEPFASDEPAAGLLSLAAGRIALALENAALRQRQQRREHEASALLEIARATTSTLELAEVLDRVVERTAHLMDADRCSIWLLADDGRTLVTAAIFGLEDAEQVARWKQRAYRVEDEALSHHVLRTGEPLAIDDALAHPLTNKEAVRWFGDQSILVVPLVCRDMPIGSLFLNHVRQPHHFTTEEIELTLALASQAAVAIQNARLYERRRETSESLTRCFRQLGALANTPGLDELLQIIVEIAAELMRVPYCAIRVLDAATNDLVFRATKGFPIDGLASVRLRPGEGLSTWVVREDRPLAVEDVRRLPGQPPSPGLVDLGIRGYLGVPLRQHGRTVGVLLAYTDRPYRFNEQEIDLLQSLANQAGIAIENAELFQTVVREKEKFAAIFNSSHNGIMTVDAERLITAINPSLERLLGRSAPELVGQSCPTVLAGCASGGPFRCDTDCPLLEARARNQALANVELRIQHRDDAPIDISVSFVWVPGAEGDEPFGLCSIHDITEIKRVERSKSEFVSMVSHELRTPLALIKGYASTLLRPDLQVEEGAQQRYLRNIDDAANKLTRLMNDLLSVSRIETGLLEIRPRSVEIVALVRNVVDAWRFSQDTQTVGLSLPAEEIQARVDPDRIQQVIENLLTNAAKYSPPGSRIEVKLTLGMPPPMADARGPWPHQFRPYEQMPGHWVAISVVDQGKGMNREQMAHVFDKFYRAETGLARTTGGLGIGLFIARGLIEAHGGRLWVESRPDRGSRFAFCLPLPEDR